MLCAVSLIITLILSCTVWGVASLYLTWGFRDGQKVHFIDLPKRERVVPSLAIKSKKMFCYLSMDP